jgi:Na+/melibiose symporter-like transporter
LAFLRRNSAFLLLAFMFIFKLADTLLLTRPFYLELGFTKSELAAITKLFGSLVSMLGLAVGGVVTAKLGIRKSLWITGILTAVANLSFTVLALTGKSYVMLFVSIGFDNFCLTMASIPYGCLIAALCDKRFSATQFAVMASISSMGGRLLSGMSGYLAEQLGWANFFAATVLAAIPGLLILAILPKDSIEFDTEEKPSTRNCPSCNAAVMEGLSFCDSCGTHIELDTSQREALAPVLLLCRRAILAAGLLYLGVGIVLPIAAWGQSDVDRIIPFIAIHTWLLTLHVGLWAWAKLSPLKALVAGFVIWAVAVASDLWFRWDLVQHWAPWRLAVLVVLLYGLRSSIFAQRLLSKVTHASTPYR